MAVVKTDGYGHGAIEIAKEIEINGIYDGTVTRIMNFGAFVDIGGGKEGLLHISKISSLRDLLFG